MGRPEQVAGRDHRGQGAFGAVLLAADVTLGGLSCLGVWLRRRWPVGFAVTASVFSAFSTAAAGVALIALFTVAVHRPLAVVGRVTAGIALASVGSALIRPDTSVLTWPQAALGIACVAAVLAWGMFVRARRQLTQSLRDQALRAESDRFAQARLHERQREILHAIARVAAGEPILSPAVTRQLIAHVGTTGTDARQRHARTVLARLSEREREVAVAVGRGRSNAQISGELFMSVATVKAHVSSMLAKLDLNNRTQIALLAHDAGLTG